MSDDFIRGKGNPKAAIVNDADFFKPCKSIAPHDSILWREEINPPGVKARSATPSSAYRKGKAWGTGEGDQERNPSPSPVRASRLGVTNQYKGLARPQVELCRTLLDDKQ